MEPKPQAGPKLTLSSLAGNKLAAPGPTPSNPTTSHTHSFIQHVNALVRVNLVGC